MTEVSNISSNYKQLPSAETNKSRKLHLSYGAKRLELRSMSYVRRGKRKRAVVKKVVKKIKRYEKIDTCWRRRKDV